MAGWLKRGGMWVAIAAGVATGEGWRSPPVYSAEYLQVDYGALSVAVPIADLQTFAETGEVPEALDAYLD